MIDNYQKEIDLLNIGYDSYDTNRMSASALSRVWYDEIGEGNMIFALQENGDVDGNNRRIYLSNLNGVCNIDGHTDVMCAHLGEDRKLTIQVNTPDDKSTIFADIDEFNHDVADQIYDQVVKYKRIIEEPETYVFTVRRGEATEVMAVSRNHDKLVAKMKSELKSFIEEVYGNEDEYLDFLTPVEEVTDFWSDEDDEYETVFSITKVKEIL